MVKSMVPVCCIFMLGEHLRMVVLRPSYSTWALEAYADKHAHHLHAWESGILFLGYLSRTHLQATYAEGVV